jgi:hypothetical protein
MTAILLFLRGVPLWVWLTLGLLGAGLFYGHLRYNAGQADVQAKWDESTARGKVEVERLKSEAGKVTVRVETKTVEVVKTVKVKGDTIVRQVPIYISRDLPELPGAFRVLHDAAATGTVPDPADFSDAAPVAPQDVASTTGDNYTACRVNAAALTGLQEWVREQHALNP